MRARDGRGDEANFDVDVDTLSWELKAKKTGKFSGSKRTCRLVLVPERDIVEDELESLDANVGEGADSGARWSDRRIRSGDIDVGDVANINVGGKEVERGDVKILEDELDL